MTKAERSLKASFEMNEDIDIELEGKVEHMECTWVAEVVIDVELGEVDHDMVGGAVRKDELASEAEGSNVEAEVHTRAGCSKDDELRDLRDGDEVGVK